MTTKKRFIAGAVCPKCEKMDKLYIEDDPTVATCIACGYQMIQRDDASVSENTREGSAALAEAVSIVNFKNKP